MLVFPDWFVFCWGPIAFFDSLENDDQCIVLVVFPEWTQKWLLIKALFTWCPEDLPALMSWVVVDGTLDRFSISYRVREKRRQVGRRKGSIEAIGLKINKDKSSDETSWAHCASDWNLMITVFLTYDADRFTFTCLSPCCGHTEISKQVFETHLRRGTLVSVRGQIW